MVVVVVVVVMMMMMMMMNSGGLCEPSLGTASPDERKASLLIV
jgi:hypothetical protein